MLGNYLKFNNTAFPNPVSSSRSSQTLENVATSEAGTDLVTIIRSSKNSWSFTFHLTSGTRDTLKSLCQNESVTMSYMGTNYTVRIRNYQEKLVDRSEWINGRTEGLYQVSVSVTEF